MWDEASQPTKFSISYRVLGLEHKEVQGQGGVTVTELLVENRMNRIGVKIDRTLSIRSSPTPVHNTLGNRLGPYEILGAIGAGGMGEVYRARDAIRKLEAFRETHKAGPNEVAHQAVLQ